MSKHRETMIRLLRTILYVPADNPRALAKAPSLPVDAVIVDLEDAVAPTRKDAARSEAIAAVAPLKASGKEVAVRINAPDTPWYNDDISEVRRAGFDGLVLPKVRTAIDVKRVALRSGMCVWPMMETAQAILEARTIAEAAASSGPAVLIIGTNDLAAEMLLDPEHARSSLTTALHMVVLAAKAAGLEAVDGVCNEVSDDRPARREAALARQMGFSGKTVIHPSQIESVNLMFSPRNNEVAEAERIVAAIRKAENNGSAVATVDGKLVETLHARVAERVIAVAAAVAAAEQAAADREAAQAAEREAAEIAEREAAEAAEREEAEASATAEAEIEAGETADGAGDSAPQDADDAPADMDMAEVAPETSDDIAEDTGEAEIVSQAEEPAIILPPPATDAAEPAPDADEEPHDKAPAMAFGADAEGEETDESDTVAFIAAEPGGSDDITPAPADDDAPQETDETADGEATDAEPAETGALDASALLAAAIESDLAREDADDDADDDDDAAFPFTPTADDDEPDPAVPPPDPEDPEAERK
ncbi:HpcH/HpaI aldolase/citrate lyase family protein [Gymnodinialimonas sp.]